MLALKHKVFQHGSRGLGFFWRWRTYEKALQKRSDRVFREAEQFGGTIGAENVVSVVEHCFPMTNPNSDSSSPLPHSFVLTIWYREKAGNRPSEDGASDGRSRRKSVSMLALKRMVYQVSLKPRGFHWGMEGHIQEVTQEMDYLRQDAEEFARKIGAENVVSVVEHCFPTQTPVPVFFTVTVWYRDKSGAKPIKDPAVDEYIAGG